MQEKAPHNIKRGYVLSAKCPSRAILLHLTGRWGGLIMIVLLKGTKRFSELRKEIDGVSERMLTQTLQQLERDGMINRKSFHTVPPHVEYSLTDYGRQAAERIYQLVDWLECNVNGLLQTRQSTK
ncbi:winged helix-turn-helix transcriptional regulator [Glaesserella sp.]|uniref:winged helix-turn-helix transcriptional regulator n=1 Tax=Glaesserella sp. TaxID=2094731 RepID=UPI00359F6F8E